MKLNKATYFSIFFLFCFLASFSVNSYLSINTKAKSHCNLKHQTSTYSQKEDNSSSNSDLLFEENEVEDGFQIQAIVIPCFVAYFLTEVSQPKIISAKPLAEKLTTPIYLAVCNFRI